MVRRRELLLRSSRGKWRTSGNARRCTLTAERFPCSLLERSRSEKVNLLCVGNIAHRGCGVLLIFNRFLWVFGLGARLIGWGIPVALLKTAER